MDLSLIDCLKIQKYNYGFYHVGMLHEELLHILKVRDSSSTWFIWKRVFFISFWFEGMEFRVPKFRIMVLAVSHHLLSCVCPSF